MYIPDMTERFPEGMRGVDMTDSYFDDGYGYEPTYEELLASGEIEPNKFAIGKQYRKFGFYGGVTVYEVQEIDRENRKILLAELWFDVDGNGTRPSEWHKLEADEYGNERALEWVSQEFGNVYIYA